MIHIYKVRAEAKLWLTIFYIQEIRRSSSGTESFKRKKIMIFIGLVVVVLEKSMVLD